MKEPSWIEKGILLSIHGQLLARFGGLDGIRDEGMLDSALNRPQQLFHYGEPTQFDLGAAYVCGLVKNHPFLDGNKRIGFVTGVLFLEMNGCNFYAPEEEAVIMTRDLAAGEVTEEAYADWLKNSCVKR